MFCQTRAHSSQNLDKNQLKTAGCLTIVKIVIAASFFVVLLQFARRGNNEVNNKRTDISIMNSDVMWDAYSESGPQQNHEFWLT